MAQYRAVIRGNRGEASRLGHKSTGIEASVNGWDLGVRVSATFDPDKGDIFEVYLTGGSHCKSISKLIGVFSQADLEVFNEHQLNVSQSKEIAVA